MAAKVNPVNPPVNGDIYLEWEILLESGRSKQKAIDALVNYIKGQVKPKAKSIPLHYELFRSETNKLSYIFRVYKKAKAPARSKKSADIMNSSSAGITSGSKHPNDMGDNGGPTRPPGPPPPPPPQGLVSITAPLDRLPKG